MPALPIPAETVKAFVEDTTETTNHIKLPMGYFHQESGRWFKYADIKEMTGNDEEAMADPRNKKNGGRILSSLLSSCTLKVGPFDSNLEIIRSLTFGDRDYLLMKIRQLSFGDDVKLDCVCPGCEAKITVKADLSKVDVLNGGMLPSQTFKLNLTRGLAYNGETYKDAVVSFPTGSDVEILAQKEYKDNSALANTALLVRNIKSVGVLTDLSVQTVSGMASVDRRLINDEIMDKMPRPDFGVVVTCSKCDTEFTETLSPASFFSQR